MVYFSYIFNLITNIMTKIIIPIPFSTEKVFYLSIFSIVMGIIVLGIIFYFVSKLLGIETNMFWNSVSNDLSWDKGYSEVERTKNSDGTNNYTIYKKRDFKRINKNTWRVKNK